FFFLPKRLFILIFCYMVEMLHETSLQKSYFFGVLYLSEKIDLIKFVLSEIGLTHEVIKNLILS
ncbi:MAG: hypothetical protein ACLBM6_21570, partial [Cuspidothrix sp.]